MNKLLKTIGIMAGVAVAASVAQADPEISGSINMAGSATLNSDSLNGATTLTPAGSALVTSGTQAYVGLAGDTATWGTVLNLTAGPDSVPDLWSVAGFDFSLASISSYIVNGSDTAAVLSGLGTLTGTGYAPTEGNFTLVITDSSGGKSGQATFGFASSDTTAGVPDGGLTMTLLGGTLLGLGALRRKLGC